QWQPPQPEAPVRHGQHQGRMDHQLAQRVDNRLSYRPLDPVQVQRQADGDEADRYDRLTEDGQHVVDRPGDGQPGRVVGQAEQDRQHHRMDEAAAHDLTDDTRIAGAAVVEVGLGQHRAGGQENQGLQAYDSNVDGQAGGAVEGRHHGDAQLHGVAEGQ